METLILLQNPPHQQPTPNGNIKEFNWYLPRINTQEKFFLSQLITSPSKEVYFQKLIALILTIYIITIIKDFEKDSNANFTNGSFNIKCK